MGNENGVWIMRGLAWNDPLRIRTWQELINWINEVGFLPLFANDIEGFSVEEHVSPNYWWTGNQEQDPWEWREIIAADKQVAYGKFFSGKAGFISLEWLPYFVNFRRNGYDFDARWEDGLASRREKLIMDLLTDHDEDGDLIFPKRDILSTELKKLAGFGKGGEKNYPGIMTGLQMQLYLVVSGFQRRTNKKGIEYGMPVSIPVTPESLWGYDLVTSAYDEKPAASWERIVARINESFPAAGESDIRKLIGRRPE